MKLFRRTLSDRDAVRRVLAGHREAYGVLVERHFPTVHAIAYAHSGNRTDTLDVAQDAFIRGLERLNTLRDAGKFGGWIAAIARSVAINRRNAERRRAVAESAVEPSPGEGTSAERGELHALLRRELQKLEPEQREVLMLHYFAGLKIRETAEVLGVTPDAAAKRIQRARDVLGRRLVDELGDALSVERPSAARQAAIMSAVMGAATPWKASATTLAATAAAAGEAVLMKKALVGVVVVLGLLGGVWGVQHARQAPEAVAPEAREVDNALQAIPPEDAGHATRSSGEGVATGSQSAMPPQPVAPQAPLQEEGAAAQAISSPGAPSQPAATGSGGAEDGMTIQGVVVTDTGDGETPVPDAMLFLEELPADDTARAEAALAQTGADGRFRLTDVSPDAGLVYAHKEGFAPGWQPVPPDSNGSAEMRIVLAAGGVVSGIVTRGDQPFAGAEISVESYNTLNRVNTDGEGRYRITGVTPGKLLVVAQAPNSNHGLTRTVIVEGGETTVVDFPFGAADSSIEGVVSVDGIPAAGGAIRLSVITADGDEVIFGGGIGTAGNYIFYGVPAGAAAMAVTAEHGDSRAYTHVVVQIGEAEAAVRDIDISLDTVLTGAVALPENVVDGVVKAMVGDVAVPELSVETLTSMESISVAAAPVMPGTYRFEGLAPGTYTLVALVYTRLPGSDEDALASLLSDALFARAVVEVEEGVETVVDLVPGR